MKLKEMKFIVFFGVVEFVFIFKFFREFNKILYEYKQLNISLFEEKFERK